METTPCDTHTNEESVAVLGTVFEPLRVTQPERLDPTAYAEFAVFDSSCTMMEMDSASFHSLMSIHSSHRN